MANVKWISVAISDWSTPTNWSSGVAPTSSDDALITQSNTPYISTGTIARAQSLQMIDSNLTVYGSLVVDHSIILTSSATYPSGTFLLLNGGSITAPQISAGTNKPFYLSGAGTVNAAVDGGYLIAHDGALIINGAALNCSSEAWSVLEFNGPSNSTVSFQGAGKLILDDPLHFTGSFADQVGATIDLRGITVTAATYDGAKLVVTYGSGQTLSFSASGSFNNVIFGSDNQGGTNIGWVTPSTITWSASSGNWGGGSNWSAGAAPTSLVNAKIASNTAPIGVTISASESDQVRALSLSNTNLIIQGALRVLGTMALSSSTVTMQGGALTASAFSGQSVLSVITGYGAVVGDLNFFVSLDAEGGTLKFTGRGNNQIATIGHDSCLDFTGGGLGHDVKFIGSNGTLQLDDPLHFDISNSISQVDLTDKIDLRGLIATSVIYRGENLTVYYGSGQSITYTVEGSVAGSVAHATSDGAGGTVINWVPAEAWLGGPGSWTGASQWAGNNPPTLTDDVFVTNVGSGTSGAGVTVYSGVAAVAQSLSLKGSNLTVYGALNIGGGLNLASSTLSLAGGTVSAGAGIAGSSPSDQGLIFGYGSVSGTIGAGVTLEANGGTLKFTGAVTGTSVFSVDANSTLEISANAPSVSFTGRSATLQLDNPTNFTGQVTGLGTTDVLDLQGIVVTNATYGGTKLTVTYGTGQTLSLNVLGTYKVSGASGGDPVSFSSDGHGGTKINWSLPGVASFASSVSLSVLLQSGSAITIADAAGYHALTNIDVIRFSDGTIYTANIAPVDVLYETYFARDATAYELSYWTARGDLANAVGELRQGILGTDLGKAHLGLTVTSFYETYLGRDPVASEMSYWVNALSSGQVSMASAQATFEGLPGAAAHEAAEVASLYQSYFGRAATSAEVSYWQGLLASGADTGEELRATLLENPAGAAHTSATITGLYDTYFGRDPSSAEVSYWSNQVLGGATFNTVRSALVTNPFGQQHTDATVSALYQSYLGRAPAAGEAGYWQGAVQAGTSLDALADALATLGSGPQITKLAATAGADSFTFSATSNHLYIDGFDPVHDNIQVKGLPSFDPLAHATDVIGQDGQHDVLITYDLNDTILLHHTSIAALTAANFLYV